MWITSSSPPSVDGPIGVFDSGIGGLSVLQALREELPHERFIYVADNGNAPYGERDEDFVRQRTHAITQFLQERHRIKALVIACNTATAAAIQEIRQHCAHLPCIGVEPALKPAVRMSHTHKVGVIGTRGTLSSEKFTHLKKSLEHEATFVLQACDGLAHAIELSATPEENSEEIKSLCEKYLRRMGEFGTNENQMDVLVLGCTHYVFAKEILQALTGPNVTLIDTGRPVAVHARRLLRATNLLLNEKDSAVEPIKGTNEEKVRLFTTGALGVLQSATQRWLQLPDSCCEIASIP